ncbi:CoA transferase, partial [uncultured Desulfovibrio sp.]
DQLTLDRIGYLSQFPQYPNQKFGDCVPRSGNQEGSGVLGWTYKCKNFATDPNDCVYIIIQRDAKSFEKFCEGMGFQDWLTNPDFNTADARDRNKQAIYKRIGEWTATRDKYEITEHLAKFAVPVGPVLSTKEIMDDESLYDGNTLVKIDQPGYGGKVGTFVTVGVPFTLSNFQPTYGPCPTLGGNNAEVLESLGFTAADVAKFAANGTTEPLPKKA